MLGQRLRRWPNTGSTVGSCMAFSGHLSRTRRPGDDRQRSGELLVREFCQLRPHAVGVFSSSKQGIVMFYQTQKECLYKALKYIVQNVCYIKESIDSLIMSRNIHYAVLLNSCIYILQFIPYYLNIMPFRISIFTCAICCVSLIIAKKLKI